VAVSAEMTRLKRDLDSLVEEISVSSGPRAKSPLSAAERRTLKAEIQGLDELAGRLS